MSTDYLASLQETELSFCGKAASFLQSDFWGGFKGRFGWKALAFKAAWKSGEVKPLLVLHRSLAGGFLRMAYVPWGPELPAVLKAETIDVNSSAENFVNSGGEKRWAALKELAAALKPLLPPGTAFIRFDPPWFIQESSFSVPAPFLRAGADIQPPDTVLLDLTQSLEALQEQMKPKWRYNARLALKKGVTVRRAGAEKAGVFYGLLKETAARDGIAVHSFDYYKTLLEEGEPKKDASFPNPDSAFLITLYLAEHEGDVLSGIVALFRKKEAVYLYGASSNKKRNLMAPYALQLKAMEDAKEAGCEVYDLFGIPPNEDPEHPMSGLYRFKTGFGGAIVHRPGSFDYPYRGFLYRVFNFAEALRKNLRTARKKELKRQNEN